MIFNGDVPGMGIPFVFLIITIPLFILLLVFIWKIPVEDDPI